MLYTPPPILVSSYDTNNLVSGCGLGLRAWYEPLILSRNGFECEAAVSPWRSNYMPCDVEVEQELSPVNDEASSGVVVHRATEAG